MGKTTDSLKEIFGAFKNWKLWLILILSIVASIASSIAILLGALIVGIIVAVLLISASVPNFS